MERHCGTCIRWMTGSVPSECYDPCYQCGFDTGFPNWEPRDDAQKEATNGSDQT